MTPAYQGTLPLYAALDSRPGYQDYLFITGDLSQPVLPEPGTLALVMLGSSLLLQRRRG